MANIDVFDMDRWIKQGLGRKNKITVQSAFDDIVWGFVAIDKLVQSVGSIRFSIKDKNGNFVQTENTINPTVRLLSKPNFPFIMSLNDLAKYFILFYTLYNEAYFNFDKVIDGHPTAIVPLIPDNIEPIFDDNGNFLHWKYTSTGNKNNSVEITSEETCFIKGSVNPFDFTRGYSVIRALRNTIEMEMYVNGWNASFFETGGNPLAVLEVKTSLTKQQRDELRAEWKKTIKGIRNGRGIMIVDNDAKFVRGEGKPKDLEFLNSKKVNREEVLGALGVPPVLVGIFEYANYANSKEQIRIFWENSIIPKINSFVNNFNAFLNNAEWNDGYYIEADFSQITNSVYTLGSKMEVAQQMKDLGVKPIVISKKLGLGLSEEDFVTQDESPNSNAIDNSQLDVKQNKGVKQNKDVDNRSLVKQVLKRYFPLVDKVVDSYIKAFEQTLRKDLDNGVFTVDEIYFEKLFAQYTNHLAVTLYLNGAKDVRKELGLGYNVNANTFTDFYGYEIEQVDTLVKQINQKVSKFVLTVKKDIESYTINNPEGDNIEEALNNAFKKLKQRQPIITHFFITVFYNSGRFFEMNYQNVQYHKWVGNDEDDSVRATHKYEQGNIVRLGDTFPITKLRYPTDPIGDLTQILNCNCYTIPIKID